VITAVFGIPGSGDILAGVALTGLGLGIGAPFLVGARRRSAILKRIFGQIVGWRILVYLFTVLWVLPYYMEKGAIDAVAYHGKGQEVAGLLLAGQWSQINWRVGTAAMDCLVGFVYVPFGANIYGMYFISALFGLGGLVLFIRAFSISQPPLAAKNYAALLVFLPSFALWSSTMGKDSIVSLGLGMSSYGYAVWHGKKRVGALLHILAGIAIVGVIRPHIAFLVLMGALVTELVCKSGANDHAGVGGRVLRFAVVAALLCTLWPVARDFVGLRETTSDAALGVSRSIAEGNQVGGSAVEASSASSPLALVANFPAGVAKVLFRPFPWEAHNFNSALAALENVLILFLVFRKARRMPGVLAGIRGQPYSCFCLVVSFALLVVLGPFTNLGLLSRERAQLLPFFFAFILTIPGRRVQRRMKAVPRRLCLQHESGSRLRMPAGQAAFQDPETFPNA
jgi:hypothetical protein